MTAVSPEVRPSRSRGSTFTSRHDRLIFGGISVATVLIVWETASRLEIVRPISVSAPTAVAAAAWREVASGELWPNLAATMAVWGAGFLAASIFGVLVGLFGGWFRRAGYIANPWLNILDAIPHLALVPIFILWFGVGYTFKVFLVFLAGVYFVAVSTMAGVRATERRYIDVATTFGASRSLLFRSVVLPGSVPYIMTGLRQAAARTLVGVVTAELVSANQGIGFMIGVAGATLNTARVMFGIFLFALLGIIVGEVLRRAEQHFDAWRR